MASTLGFCRQGGAPLAIMLNEIENRALAEERIPFAWKGGRLVELYKRKGVTSECKSFRGLLVADHAAKAFIGKLGDRAKAKVEGALPEDQYGGRKGGGTDIPAHIIQSLLAFARMASMSVFLLFVDLVAAYDSAIREVAFDVPRDFVGTRVEYLVSIGVDVDVAEFVDSIVSSVGCSFDQAHVDPKTTRMINVLHTRAWAKFGFLASVIVSTKGGRQGCKLGGVVFAMVFAQAMMRVRRELACAGISLRCKCSSSAPFGRPVARAMTPTSCGTSWKCRSSTTPLLHSSRRRPRRYSRPSGCCSIH